MTDPDVATARAHHDRDEKYRTSDGFGSVRMTEAHIDRGVLLKALAAQRAAGAAAERERCATMSDLWAESPSCSYHDENPCCHVRTATAIAASIRAQPVAPPEAPR